MRREFHHGGTKEFHHGGTKEEEGENIPPQTQAPNCLRARIPQWVDTDEVVLKYTSIQLIPADNVHLIPDKGSLK